MRRARTGSSTRYRLCARYSSRSERGITPTGLPSRATTTALVRPVSVANTSSSGCETSTAASGGCRGAAGAHRAPMAARAEPLREVDRAPRRRAARAAGEQARLAREAARGQERVAVGDADPLVDDVAVHRLRPRVLADPLDEVRVEVGV